MSDARAAELGASLAAVGSRIDDACRAAGRDRSSVTLVVVTKTFPPGDVARLAAAGVRDVGENKDQEAGAKAAELADLHLRWHFIGQLQTNKARSVARYASVVHSLDRPRLVTALGRGADEAQRELGVLVQVDLDEGVHDATRGGAAPADVPALAEQVATTSGLRLRGLMAVAPLGERPEGGPDGVARAFDRLAELSRRLRADHPDAGWLSAGMSGDLEQAVAAGATHLRVGSAVLGRRPALQ